MSTKIDILIQRYLDGESSEEERIAILNWISQSNENLHLFYTRKRLNDAVRAKSYRPKKSKSKTIIRSLIYSSVAAILLVAFLIFNNTATTVSSLVAYETLDNTDSIVLDDNSVVELNRNSSIECLHQFSENRELTLKGEAYFKVAKDSLHPFTVKASGVLITVKGTQFNVRIDSLKNAVTVTVDEGIVHIQNEKTLENIVLTKNTRAIFNKEGGIEYSKEINDNYLSWKTHFLQFKDTPLEMVAADLKNCYGVQLHFADEMLKNCKLTAKINDYPIENVIDMLKLAFNIEIKENIKNKQYTLSGEGCR